LKKIDIKKINLKGDVKTSSIDDIVKNMNKSTKGQKKKLDIDIKKIKI